MSVRRFLKPAIAAVVLAGVGAGGYWMLYEEPRQALQAEIEEQSSANAVLERAIRDRNRVRQQLREVAATTIGATADEVDARLRSGLNRIAEFNGLGDVQVNTNSPQNVASPVRLGGRRSTEGPDFQTIRGDLTAAGTLEQVLRTIALAQVQPWLHRVERFEISPVGRDGRERDRFSLRLSVSTLVMRDLAPRDVEAPRVADLPAEAELAYASMLARNPFREPPREVAQQERRAGSNPPPPPPPYNEWRLAGVVESRLGTEAFLVNTRNEERMVIGEGSSVAGARLVAAQGEKAIFEIEGEEYEVFNGQTLEQRRPATR